MRDIILTLDRFGDQALLLGRVGENRATRILVDLKSILSQYPDAIASITVKPPDRAEYPATVKQEGGILTWEITRADVCGKAGNGLAQITIRGADGTVIKTAIACTRIDESLINETDQAPDPVETWIDKATGTLADVKRAGNAAQAVADEAQRRLDNGDFVGPQGPQGAKGEPGKDAVIDATLTQEGEAADAKATGDAISQLKGDLADVDTRLSESITEISDVAKRLELTFLKTKWEYGDLIGNGVEADSTYLKRTGYLDEKVITFETNGAKVYVYYFDKNKVFKAYKSYTEDHIISVAEYDDVKYIRLVIREENLNNVVFKTTYPMNDGTLGYVTPEIFGAIGDKLTDDTEAVQKCFEFARVTSQLGDFPKRIKLAQSYKITKTILISGLRYCDVSVDGNILYTGVESAFLISGCRFTDFSFGIILAGSGDCIRFASNSNTDDYVSYCKLKFKRLYAKNACIRMSIGATGGYINENTIVGGCLSNGEYGIYVDAKGRSEVQFKSYNLGFEGVNVGACLDGASYCSFINPRYGEMKDKTLIRTLSESKNIQFVGIDLLIPSMLELSANTSMSINAPIIPAHNGPILSYNGKVEGGVLKYAVQTFENA